MTVFPKRFFKMQAECRKNFIKKATSLPLSMEDKLLTYNGVPISYRFNNIDKKRPTDLVEGTITDAYYLDNEVKDTVNIPQEFTLEFLKLHGYTNVKVKMSHSVSEIYDGWQYCALYDFNEEEQSKITEKYHDHGYHTTVTEYKRIDVVFDSFNIDKLLNNNTFFIRYRGSGYGRDDWKNKDVCVRVEFAR